MVDDQPVLQLRTRWFPTRASGERSMLMELEFATNGRGEKGKPSEQDASRGKLRPSSGIEQARFSMHPLVNFLTALKHFH